MQASDKDEFIKVMIKEIEDHIQCKYWELVLIELIPYGIKVLDVV